jgi:lipopolysaccharide biosynthesis glycosyltransferase
MVHLDVVQRVPASSPLPHPSDEAQEVTAPPIVMACDEGYAMPLATALRSLADSNHRHWPLDVYVLCDGFRQDTKQQVQASLPTGSIRLHWRQINLDRFARLGTPQHVSQMTFARFLLADFVPQSASRALYLDADILVLGDLRALWATDLEGNSAAAVTDHGLDPLLRRRDPRCDGMPTVQRYFNAGVLLIDMSLWRQQQVGERAALYLAEHPNSPYADQDALNHVLDGVWKDVGERWNYQCHHETSIERMSADSRPAVIHFVTSAKPWKRQFQTANEAFFDNFRSRTRFSRTFGIRLADAFTSRWVQLKRGIKRFAATRVSLQ